MKTVVFSVLGTQLDAGRRADRWKRWRPTVALCQQADLVIDRLELIHDDRHAEMARFIANDIAQVSPETRVAHHIIAYADPWDFGEVYAHMLQFVDGYRFRPDRERYLVNLTTGTHVNQICWFMLAETRAVPGQLIQLSPPHRRGGSMAGDHHVIDLDLSRYDHIATRFAVRQEEGASFLKHGIVTRDASFNAMIEQIEKVVIRSRAPVLLLGPTGAGKSQLARRIYELKKARHQIIGAFVEVNCATLRGDNAMSALFGHRRGAFTGAVADRPGLLKAADQGLLFLDEIGELGLDEQAMILRAIEDKRFLPVGADKETSSSFQLITGTNRDLRAAVRAGSFREDLLARLDLWTFELPGLKDRRVDIEPNLAFELDRFAGAEGDRVSFNKEAQTTYLQFATSIAAEWTGNFRDLGASITRMATLAEKGRITVPIVDAEIERLQHAWQTGIVKTSPALDSVFSIEQIAALDEFDRAQLECVVDVCRRSKSLSEAGRALFAVSRQNKRSSNDADRLRKYLGKFGLDWAHLQ